MVILGLLGWDETTRFNHDTNEMPRVSDVIDSMSWLILRHYVTIITRSKSDKSSCANTTDCLANSWTDRFRAFARRCEVLSIVCLVKHNKHGKGTFYAWPYKGMVTKQSRWSSASPLDCDKKLSKTESPFLGTWQTHVFCWGEAYDV